MSTVIVHAITGSDHHIMAFPEVDVATSSPSPYAMDPWSIASPPFTRMVYTITGEGGVQMEGTSLEEAYSKLVSHQAQETARVRYERDRAHGELNRLRGQLRDILNPPAEDSDDDEEDY